MEMNNNDLELKLLSGVPIDVGVGKLYPLTLAEIRELGEQLYNRYIGVVSVDPKKLNLKDETIQSYELALTLCLVDPVFRQDFLNAMSLFFKEEMRLHESGVFFIGDFEKNEIKALDKDSFEYVRHVIRKQNFISEKQDEFDGFKIAEDEETKRIMEMRKKIKERIKQENKDNGLDLFDVISIVASHIPNINFFNVWDLTIFQLYTLYSRLMMKESYESNFAIYVQSGDSSKLDLTHWARKLKNI